MDQELVTPSSATSLSTSPVLVPIVAVGASAGGLEAIVALLSEVPADFAAAFIIITHLDPTHKSLLPEILARATRLEVFQAHDYMRVETGKVYVIPPNRELTISGNILRSVEHDRPRGFRTPVNTFLESMARGYRSKATAIILSGSGSDGSQGIKVVKDQGGYVIVQNPFEAKYDGMPQSAINTGRVDSIVSVHEMATVIQNRLEELEMVVDPGLPPSSPLFGKRWDKPSVDCILKIIFDETGQDFSGYKNPTVWRRIARRVEASKCASLEAYQAHLKANPTEISALRNELLINVTRFFRDPSAFESLKQKVIPGVLDCAAQTGGVRLWVAGCSTGEEAYSLAILFVEEMRKRQTAESLTVFATDIDSDALATARIGYYEASEVEGIVPEEYLESYFTKDGEGYRIAKRIREKVVFSLHDLATNPPLSQLDLISCRNVFIYFNVDLQKKLLTAFHYALRNDGYLFMGSAESVGNLTDGYAARDEKSKIYQRHPLLNTFSSPSAFLIARAAYPELVKSSNSRSPAEENSRTGSIGDFLLSHLLPPCAVVNERFEVVFWGGDIKKHLRISTGQPSLDLFQLLDPSVHLEVRSALLQAVKNRVPSKYDSVSLTDTDAEGQPQGRQFTIEAQPIISEGRDQGLTLVSFVQRPVNLPAQLFENTTNTQAQLVANELAQVKASLSMVLAEAQVSHQELVASNEELMSTNEELQSTAEELETSREELQSLNEELEAVNSELRRKVQELTDANNDMNNLLIATEIGVLFLDNLYRIKNFTPTVTRIFNLIKSDLQRPLSHVSHRIRDFDIESFLRTIRTKGGVLEGEVHTEDGATFVLRGTPYRTEEKQVDGVVLTFIDVTRLRSAEKALANRENQFVTMFKAIPDAVMVIGRHSEILDFRPGNLGATLGPGPFIGEKLAEMPPHLTYLSPSHLDSLALAVSQCLLNQTAGEVELVAEKDGNARWIDVRIVPGGPEYAVCAFRDVTQKKEADRLRVEKLSSETIAKAKGEFLTNVSHELRTPLNAIIGFADILLMGISGEMSTQQREQVQNIAIAGKHLLDLVNEVLDLAKLESSDVPLTEERVELASLLEEVSQTCRPLFESGGIALAPLPVGESTPVLKADLKRCKQMLLNLLSNAVKFTPKGGVIQIRWQLQEKGLEILVADSGIGVPPSFLEKVFERFEQARRPVNENSAGTGLGLALVKNIIKAHQGEVWASVPGLNNMGTTFHLLFPPSRLLST